MTLLQCQGVTVRFGALRALDDVGIEVNRGEIVGLLGPNGAGKTLLFDCISGLQPLERGHIYLNDDDITNAPGFWRTWQGIGRTFQDGRLFEHMTVEMNVAVGACVRGTFGPASSTEVISERYGIGASDLAHPLELQADRVTSWRGFAITSSAPKSARHLRLAQG